MNQLEQDIYNATMYKLACYDEEMEKTAVKKQTYLSILSKKLKQLTKGIEGAKGAINPYIDSKPDDVNFALSSLVKNLGGKRLNSLNLPYPVVTDSGAPSRYLGEALKQRGRSNDLIEAAKNRASEISGKLTKAKEMFNKEFPDLDFTHDYVWDGILGKNGFTPGVDTDIATLPGKFIRSKANDLFK